MSSPRLIDIATRTRDIRFGIATVWVSTGVGVVGRKGNGCPEDSCRAIGRDRARTIFGQLIGFGEIFCAFASCIWEFNRVGIVVAIAVIAVMAN